MAFLKKNWSGNIAGIGMGGPKVHSYAGLADALATIGGAGYFNTVQSEIDTGDVVITNTGSPATAAKIWMLINTAGVITAVALTP